MRFYFLCLGLVCGLRCFICGFSFSYVLMCFVLIFRFLSCSSITHQMVLHGAHQPLFKYVIYVYPQIDKLILAEIGHDQVGYRVLIQQSLIHLFQHYFFRSMLLLLFLDQFMKHVNLKLISLGSFFSSIKYLKKIASRFISTRLTPIATEKYS